MFWPKNDFFIMESIAISMKLGLALIINKAKNVTSFLNEVTFKK